MKNLKRMARKITDAISNWEIAYYNYIIDKLLELSLKYPKYALCWHDDMSNVTLELSSDDTHLTVQLKNVNINKHDILVNYRDGETRYLKRENASILSKCFRELCDLEQVEDTQSDLDITVCNGKVIRQERVYNELPKEIMHRLDSLHPSYEFNKAISKQ